jgi:hypothetical protein
VRSLVLHGSLILLAALAGGAAQAEKVNFDRAKPGKPPSGWLAAHTGKGEPRWTVEKDESAPSQPNVLKQSGQATYTVCLKRRPRFKNGFVEVRFKAITGKQDQAGGVVWRAKDSNNYYVCRANALEDNVVLYKTEQGKRKALDIVGRQGGYGATTKVAANQWHTLRVEFADSRFQVFFNGQHLFDVEDGTFAEPGQVGVWTKADSVTLFDDFSCGQSRAK